MTDARLEKIARSIGSMRGRSQDQLRKAIARRLEAKGLRVSGRDAIDLIDEVISLNKSWLKASKEAAQKPGRKGKKLKNRLDPSPEGQIKNVTLSDNSTLLIIENNSTTKDSRRVLYQEIDALIRTGLERRKLRAAIIDACIRRGYTRQAAISVANRHTRSDAPPKRPLHKRIREEQQQQHTEPGIQYTSAQIDQLLGNWIRGTAQIGTRPQQAAFRKMVLEVYGRICAVTGSNEENVLEAAHIGAYSGPLSDRISNGICLRADIHKLYDAGLISFTPDFRVHVSNRVADERYRTYHGQLLRLPLRRCDWPYLTPSKA